MGKTKHKKHHRHGDGDDEVGDDSAASSGLKLILKVGSKGHEKHKKKKKKKDKKKERDKERKHRHHHKEKRLNGGESSEVIKLEEGVVVSEEVTRERSQKALSRLLEYMLNHLQSKDTNGFFANPVNDLIAPGYSSIISQPMDFSTMRSKLQDYKDLASFRANFELICTNAMTYNTVDTIYYKMAAKMLHYGQKFFSVDKLRAMKKHLPFAQAIPDECLGIDASSVLEHENTVEEDPDDDVNDVSKVIEDIREVVRRPPGRFEAIPDDLTSAEILEQAKMAARGAANRLKIYKPDSKMGFLRQKTDGSTSLKFLTGTVGIVPGTENERPVSLGQLIGKVKQGTGSIQGFREDRRNVAKAIHPLYYGAFSTHGPSYDSTFSNLTKEETELVYRTYTNSDGVQYAESVLNYAGNSDNFLISHIVHHLLNVLGNGEHKQTYKYIEERKSIRKEEELLDYVFKDMNEEIAAAAKEAITADKSAEDKDGVDFDSLKSLQDDIGIDMSFLENLQKYYAPVDVVIKTESDETELLKANAQLIDQLNKVQAERLSATPPPHFTQMQRPGEKELELASSIQSNLVEIIGQLKPTTVVPEALIQSALGICVKKPKEQPMEVD